MPYTLEHSSLETHYKQPPSQVKGMYGDLSPQWKTARHNPNCLFMVPASLQTPAKVFEGAGAS